MSKPLPALTLRGKIHSKHPIHLHSYDLSTMWPFRTYPELTCRELRETYDYVILGGGTAGCVLANRLSSDPSVSVLLVERGSAHDTWAARVPLFSNPFSPIPAPFDKQSSVADAALGGRTQDLFNGRALGGTSRLNAMLYTRGLAAEYNAWTQAGRQGWSYDELLPLFKKSQRSWVANPGPEAGLNGEWNVIEHETIYFNHQAVMFDAGRNLGLPYLPDVNSSSSAANGCIKTYLTQNPDGTRGSTFGAFLPESVASSRKSWLHICTNTSATKLDVQNADGSVAVHGVFLQPAVGPGKAVCVQATREVILCSGPLENPRILQLSGIGPGTHLRTLEIPILKDLPGVGAHLQDHVAVPSVFNVPMDDCIYKYQRQPLSFLKELVKYVLFGTGILTSPVIDISVFVNSQHLNDQHHLAVTKEQQDSTRPENLPDIEIMPSFILTSESPSAVDPHDIDLRTGKFSTMAILLRPKSTGAVRIRSSNPSDPLDIDLNTLSDPSDWIILRKAIRLSLALVKEMRALGYPATDYRVPADASDAAIDKHILKQARTTYHYSSTCRMAPEHDEKPGVVDDELRVHGVKGLRVADSSIFPQIPATHLQAPAVVVAEKCAELIKATW